VTEKQLLALFDKWIPRLGLDGWVIQVRVEECPDKDDAGSEGCCHRSSQYDKATIFVPPAMLEEGERDRAHQDITPEYVEQIVVHELLHCVVRDIVFANSLMEDELSERMNETLNKVQMRTEEQVVERLASALMREWA
jgi:hypothetical protein